MSAPVLTATSAPTDQCPEGVYAGFIKEIKVWQSQQANNQYGNDPQLLWVFVLKRVIWAAPVLPTAQNPTPSQPAEWLDKELWGFTSQAMTPNARARQWIEAIIGRELGENEAFNLGSLYGQRVAITVGRSQTGKAKVTQVGRYEPNAPVQTAMTAAPPPSAPPVPAPPPTPAPVAHTPVPAPAPDVAFPPQPAAPTHAAEPTAAADPWDDGWEPPF